MKVNIRQSTLIVLTFISVWYILSPYIFMSNGVKVISIDNQTGCPNLDVGDIITQIEGTVVSDLYDFETALTSISSGKRVTMIVNGGPGSCNTIGDSDIGVEVSSTETTGLVFGADISGGERLVVSSDGGLTQTKSEAISELLKQRAKVADMSILNIEIDNSKLIVYTEGVKGISELLIRGEIVCAIEQKISLSNGTGVLKIGNDSFEIVADNESISVSGNSYGIGDSLSVSGIDFTVVNVTSDGVVLDGIVFDNDDIERVGESGYVNYESSTQQYVFVVPVNVSENAGKRFAKITDSMAVVYGSGNDVLDGVLIYYLDGEAMSILTIPSDMSGDEIETISIAGGGYDMEDAMRNRMLFDIALEGKIDETLSIDSVSSFDGELSDMPIIFGLSIVMLIGIVSIISIIRYRDARVSVIGALLLGTVVFCIIGIVAATQSISYPGISIDSVLLIGIIIFGILNAADIILVSEKVLKNRVVKFHKNIMFVVFAIGFALLFTEFNKIGIVLILGQIISTVFTTHIYKGALRRN